MKREADWIGNPGGYQKARSRARLSMPLTNLDPGSSQPATSLGLVWGNESLNAGGKRLARIGSALDVCEMRQNGLIHKHVATSKTILQLG